jgi:hypothetical protein
MVTAFKNSYSHTITSPNVIVCELFEALLHQGLIATVGIPKRAPPRQ